MGRDAGNVLGEKNENEAVIDAEEKKRQLMMDVE